MVTRPALLAIAAVCVIGASPVRAAVEIVGSERATIGWQTATGPIAGYNVFTSFNGNGETLYETVGSTQNFAVLNASYGDAVVLRVAAFDENGSLGPLSESSETIVFLPDDELPPAPPPSTSSIPMDFNGDTMSDILVHNPDSGHLQIWMMNGTQVTQSSDMPQVFDDTWIVAATGDLNGDRHADMIFRHISGTIGIWLNQNGRVTETIMYGGLGEWKVVGTADLNGDDRDDLLFRHSTGHLYVWFMNGVQIESSASLGSPPMDWTIDSMPDLNGDGRDDLLWRHTTGALYAWLMDANEIVAAQTVPAPGMEWTLVGMPDLDGDGAREILWRHETGMLYAWFLNGLTIADYGGIEDPGLEWSIVGLRDFDGDRRDDFLWQHTNGLLYTWFMDGRILDGGGVVGAPGSGYHVVDDPAS